jgi:quercetin dioxygenase-like cupin family protein
MKFERLAVPEGTRFRKSGKVTLSPGESVGEHSTGENEEIIIVLKGRAKIEESNTSKAVGKGGMHFIPKNSIHNVTNESDDLLQYIYIVGNY